MNDEPSLHRKLPVLAALPTVPYAQQFSVHMCTHVGYACIACSKMDHPARN